MKQAVFRILGLLIVLLSAIDGRAQITQPSKWKVRLEPATVAIGGQAELVFNASIDKGWYLYSSDFDPSIGPTVTTVKVEPQAGLEVIGKLIPIGAKEKFDPVWEAKIRYFTTSAEFRQKVKISKPISQIKVSYDGQVCTEIDGKCIQVNGDFEVPVQIAGGSPQTAQVAPKPAEEQVTTSGSSPELTDTASLTQPDNASGTVQAVRPDTTAVTTTNDISTTPSEQGDSGLFSFFLLSFLAGLAALLTPCVFPMIPMTVSFFTKRQPSRAAGIRKAILYGLFIIGIYTIIGTVIARINGPEFANFLSTHWLPNILFFIVFVLFGISFLGAFEIVLPGTLVNKIDSESEKGGLYGLFFMALTIVVVSFSCTGPVVGSVLVASAGGAVLKPVIGMFGFSLAFALPFTLFAIFPQALQQLPKSGGWLNSVKVVLGFIELALSLKFLSVADQAYHWHLLDREVYLALWIVIFALLGFYLLGKINLPHDTPTEKTSITGLLLAVVTFSFVAYLIPGLWGAPLKQLSGYLPPINTQDFVTGVSASNSGTSSSQTALCDAPRHADILHWPHNLNGYFDYKQALACAKEQNKPLFIDFTGHGCVNCREMEARVWADARVQERLRNNFVLVALYVDDKTELPESEWYTSTYDGKQKTSIGKQNADFQITKFNNNAQPYYCILDHQENLLIQPSAHNLDVDAYIKFLDDAVANFKSITVARK